MGLSAGYLTACGIAMSAWAMSSANAAIDVESNTINMFRDLRASNDVGQSAGDKIQYGADISGGSLGDYERAMDLTSGFTTGWATCAPLTTDPNICAGSTAYSTAVATDTWQIEFATSTSGANAVYVAAPSLQGSQTVPGYPSTVTVTGTGTNPTISWTNPASGFAGNGIRVNIFDKNQITANGGANIIATYNFSTPINSFQVPAQLLQVGGNYAIGLQLINSRGNVPFAGGNQNILARSNSYFDFSPLGPGGPANVFLPSIQQNGVYNFSVLNVGPNSITFIDPSVSTGYDYATGVGDPNFASVTLPDVGGGKFTLHYTVNGQSFAVALSADTQYYFPAAGVGFFEVTGIDPSAMVDPTNGESFVTGLTFESDGNFTGTMTPLTEPVPEPQTMALMGVGLLGLGLRVVRGRKG